MQRLLSAIGFLLACPFAPAQSSHRGAVPGLGQRSAIATGSTLFRRWVPAILLLWAAAAHADCPPPRTANDTVTTECPPPAVHPCLPLDGTVTADTTIAFKWNPAGEHVTGYRLYAFIDGSKEAQAIKGCENSSHPECTATLKPGHYEWFVRNPTNDCPKGNESTHFRLQIHCDPPGGFALGVPAVNGTHVTLNWQGATGAQTYSIYTRTSPTDEFKKLETIKSITGTSYCVGLTKSSNFEWYVLAENTCRSTTSAAPPGTFRTGECRLGKPSQLQTDPSQVKRGGQVTFRWTPADSCNAVVFYSVWLKLSSETEYVQLRSTRSTSITWQGVYGDHYEWYVEANDDESGCSVKSDHRSFSTVN